MEAELVGDGKEAFALDTFPPARLDDQVQRVHELTRQVHDADLVLLVQGQADCCGTRAGGGHA